MVVGAMSMFRRFLAGLFMALLFSSSAHAADPVMQFRVRSVPESVPWVAVPVDACSLAIPHRFTFPAHWSFTHLGTQSPPVECFYFNTPDNYTSPLTLENRLWCPGTDSAPVNGQCEETCTVGATKVLTFGVGWSATGEDDPNEGTMGIPPMSWCDGSCMFSFNEVIAVYMDEEVSANGYYEITSTSEYVGTGATCTTPSEPPENPDPEPPCGDGNCTPGDGDGGGPGDGDGGGDPGDGDGDGDDGDTPGGENPGDGAGGDGDGDGENPGDDGPGGGTGPGGDGEGEDEGGGECGIDGKPACKVKVDESGMPSDATRQAQQSAARAAALGAVDDGAGDVSNVLGQDFPEVRDVPWLWNVSLPAGACSPISFNTRAITTSYDVCSHPLMTAWREAWAYLIGVLGAIYIWRRTTASVGSA